MDARPRAAARVVPRILSRMALDRMARLGLQLKGRQIVPGAPAGTGGRLGPILTTVVMACLTSLLAATLFEANLVHLAARVQASTTDGRSYVSSVAYLRADYIERRLARGDGIAPDLQVDMDGLRGDLRATVEKGRPSLNIDERERRALDLFQKFRAQGRSAFWTIGPGMGFMTFNWGQPASSHALGAVAGLLLAVWLMALFLLVGRPTLASGLRDDEVRWLATLPIAPKTLRAAILACRLVLAPMTWLVLLPVAITTLLVSGAGLATLPLALAQSVICGTLAIGISESLIRAGGRRVNRVIRLLCLTLATVALGTLGLAAFGKVPETLYDHLLSEPAWLLMSPTSIPVLCLGEGLKGGAILSAFVWSAISGLFLMFGPAVAGGAAAIARRGRRAVWPRGRFGGLLGKEARSVVADASLVLNGFVAPVVVGWGGLSFGSFATAERMQPIAAFAVGAIPIVAGVSRGLAAERGMEWLLGCLPQRMDQQVLRKMGLWTAVGWIFATAMTVALVCTTKQTPGSFLRISLVYAALGLLAWLVAAIEGGVWRRLFGRSAGSGGMGLAVGMGIAVAIGFSFLMPADQQVQILALLCLMALALWGEACNTLASITEPDGRPWSPAFLATTTVCVFAGVIGALNLIFLRLLDWSAEVSAVVATVAALASAFLVDRTFGSVAVRDKEGALRDRVATAVVGVVVASLLGLLAAASHKWVGSPSPVMTTALGLKGTLLFVAVIGVCEELVFRLLVQRRLEIQLGPRWAILWTGAGFAVMHDLRWAPILFALGVCSALVFQRSRQIVGSLAIHVTYNVTYNLILWWPFAG